MPQKITAPNVSLGEVVFSWSVKEYEQYVRDRRWYIVMGGVGLVFLVYSIFTANYLFALIVILFGIIMYLHDIQTPLDLPFAITTTGIVLGTKYYRFSELNNFWIIYTSGGVQSLYFSLQSPFTHRLQIPLLDNDPMPIREFLLEYLSEDLEQEEEPLTDRLSRILKIH